MPVLEQVENESESTRCKDIKCPRNNVFWTNEKQYKSQIVTKTIAGSSIVFCHLPRWQSQTSESLARCHVRFLLVISHPHFPSSLLSHCQCCLNGTPCWSWPCSLPGWAWSSRYHHPPSWRAVWSRPSSPRWAAQAAAAASLPTATGPEPASAGDHLPSSSSSLWLVLLLLAYSSSSNISLSFSQSQSQPSLLHRPWAPPAESPPLQVSSSHVPMSSTRRVTPWPKWARPPN